MTSSFDVIAGGATAGALIFTAQTFLKSRKTNQLRLIEGIFKDIRGLQAELMVIKNQPIIDDQELPGERNTRQSDWDSRFFNTLEWYSFLVNENYVKDKKMIGFFDDAIIDWYENIFLKHMKKAIDNPKQFPEFEKLYQRLKTCQLRQD